MPLRSDPGRLPRRNHYQEGPGFLFLATQGGRPLEADVAADVASVIRLRAAALRRWHEGDPATQVGGRVRRRCLISTEEHQLGVRWPARDRH